MCSGYAFGAFSEESLIDARTGSLLFLLLIFLDLFLVFETEAELSFDVSFIKHVSATFDCTI